VRRRAARVRYRCRRAGILRLTNTNLAAAIRVSLFEKGLDPRDFTLLSFGGRIGSRLRGGGRTRYPAHHLSGRRLYVLRARRPDGGYRARLRRSGVRPFDGSAVTWVRSCFESLKAEGTARSSRRIASANRQFELSADLRYRGQAFELTVPWGEVAIDEHGIGEVRRGFHTQHAQRFSYASPEDAVELVTLRLAAIAEWPARRFRPQTRIRRWRRGRQPPRYVDGQWRDIATWRRDAIAASLRISGPAIVEEDYTAVFVGPGWSLHTRRDGHLVAARSEVLA